MKSSKFTEEQIVFALKQAETGTPVKEVIRKMGITEQTFYRWKKKYGGMMPNLLQSHLEFTLEVEEVYLK
jgi:transposase-like protein